MTLRVIDTGTNTADWNVAASAEMVELHRKGLMSDTLRLHRYDRCVLIGASQEVGAAVDVRACEARKIPIVRRQSGGGAVYMSPGVFVWEIVAERKRFGTLDAAAMRVNSAIAEALRSTDVAASHVPPNSIVVASRKIGGAGGAHDGGTVLMHGTVLCDVDLAELAACLRADSTALVTLADLLPALPDIAPSVTDKLAALWKEVAA